MNIKMKDGDGKMPVAAMRKLFGKCVRNTEMIAKRAPLGIVKIDGAFSHYKHQETDTLWIGFALGLRLAERILAAKRRANNRDEPTRASGGTTL